MSSEIDNRHFLFRIGPFGSADGKYFMYFLQPGDYAAPGVEAVDDQSAIRELIKSFPAETLVAEPAMAEAAALFGIPAINFDDYASHALGLLAMEFLSSSPVRDIEREWVVFSMLRNARNLEQQIQQQNYNGTVKFKLLFVGTVEFEAYATFTASYNKPKELVLFNTVVDRDESTDTNTFLKKAESANLSCLGVLFRTDDQVVLDALKRAFGLRVIPEPVLFSDGNIQPAQDVEVLILAAALNALSQHFEGQRNIEAYIEIEDLAVGVRLFD